MAGQLKTTSSTDKGNQTEQALSRNEESGEDEKTRGDHARIKKVQTLKSGAFA